MSPRSARLPWLRSGLLGLVAPLLPFVWVVESSSCGGAQRVESTGVEVLARFEPEAWPVLVLVLAIALLTPVLAPRLLAQRPGQLVWAHVLGLVACALSTYGLLFALYFTIFSEREATLAGLAVLGLFGACVLDALARLAWSAQEWRGARREK